MGRISLLIFAALFTTATSDVTERNDWSIAVGTTMSCCRNDNVWSWEQPFWTMSATIASPLGGNSWIVAGINKLNLIMIKIFVTGKTSYDWIEARYSNLDWIDSNCRFQSTFTEDCYQGPRKRNQDYYHADLVAFKGSCDFKHQKKIFKDISMKFVKYISITLLISFSNIQLSLFETYFFYLYVTNIFVCIRKTNHNS